MKKKEHLLTRTAHRPPSLSHLFLFYPRLADTVAKLWAAGDKVRKARENAVTKAFRAARAEPSSLKALIVARRRGGSTPPREASRDRRGQRRKR